MAQFLLNISAGSEYDTRFPFGRIHCKAELSPDVEAMTTLWSMFMTTDKFNLIFSLPALENPKHAGLRAYLKRMVETMQISRRLSAPEMSVFMQWLSLCDYQEPKDSQVFFWNKRPSAMLMFILQTLGWPPFFIRQDLYDKETLNRLSILGDTTELFGIPLSVGHSTNPRVRFDPESCLAPPIDTAAMLNSFFFRTFLCKPGLNQVPDYFPGYSLEGNSDMIVVVLERVGTGSVPVSLPEQIQPFLWLHVPCFRFWNLRAVLMHEPSPDNPARITAWGVSRMSHLSPIWYEFSEGGTVEIAKPTQLILNSSQAVLLYERGYEPQAIDDYMVDKAMKEMEAIGFKNCVELSNDEPCADGKSHDSLSEVSDPATSLGTFDPSSLQSSVAWNRPGMLKNVEISLETQNVLDNVVESQQNTFLNIMSRHREIQQDLKERREKANELHEQRKKYLEQAHLDKQYRIMYGEQLRLQTEMERAQEIQGNSSLKPFLDPIENSPLVNYERQFVSDEMFQIIEERALTQNPFKEVKQMSVEQSEQHQQQKKRKNVNQLQRDIASAQFLLDQQANNWWQNSPDAAHSNAATGLGIFAAGHSICTTFRFSTGSQSFASCNYALPRGACNTVDICVYITTPTLFPDDIRVEINFKLNSQWIKVAELTKQTPRKQVSVDRRASTGTLCVQASLFSESLEEQEQQRAKEREKEKQQLDWKSVHSALSGRGSLASSRRGLSPQHPPSAAASPLMAAADDSPLGDPSSPGLGGRLRRQAPEGLALAGLRARSQSMLF